MRTIAEIKADIALAEKANECEVVLWKDCPTDCECKNHCGQLYEYIEELRSALVAHIPLDELEQYAQARSEGCGYCKGDGEVSFVYHVSQTDCGIQTAAKFCPMCGRHLGNTP